MENEVTLLLLALLIPPYNPRVRLLLAFLLSFPFFSFQAQENSVSVVSMLARHLPFLLLNKSMWIPLGVWIHLLHVKLGVLGRAVVTLEGHMCLLWFSCWNLCNETSSGWWTCCLVLPAVLMGTSWGGIGFVGGFRFCFKQGSSAVPRILMKIGSGSLICCGGGWWLCSTIQKPSGSGPPGSRLIPLRTRHSRVSFCPV